MTATGGEGLKLRIGYFDDRRSFRALADLLRDIFDIDIGLLDGFGGPDPTSMPFGYFDAAGRCVANFSAVSMPLIIGGRPVRAVGYQSGAVRPDYRGRGLYRDLMRRAFAWSHEQGFELGLLLTDQPALYHPYGFRSMPQHAFRGPTPAATRAAAGARALSAEDTDDIHLVRRLLAGREPVSTIFAIAGHTVEFLLNASFDPDVRLSHLPHYDAVVAWKVVDDAFRLLDVVAAEVPPLAGIVGALDVKQTEMLVCFPPDRIDWPEGRPAPYAGACELMIAPMRSAALPAGPFMLSPMAEF